MVIKNLFIGGIMDKDTHKSFVKAGVFRHAENLRFYINNGEDGTGVNIKGSLMVSDKTDGKVYKTVGAYFNNDKDVIYYFLAPDTETAGHYSKIIEYDIKTGVSTRVLEGELSFNYNDYITGIDEIDGLAYFSELGNPPRRINVERAKTLAVNAFTEDDIINIVYPPLQKIKVTLQDTTTPTQTQNNIEEKFIAFSYRYRYLDGEYSVLAPFTEFAFEPEHFDYDFSEQTNKGMINKFNQVKLEFNTGSERVKEIQLVFKESGSNSEWIIDDFDKDKLGWGNNQLKSFEFDNLKAKRALPDNVIRSLFDNVPKTAKAQTMIDGRLIYGNYKEQFDIVDDKDIDIEINYDLEQENVTNKIIITINGVNIEIGSGNPKQTARSNRDYEVKLAYLFNYSRMTTLLASKTNTMHINADKSDYENHLWVNLKHKPPKGAKYYRFFIRQNKKGYDTILPTLFYEDGVYRWIKLEGRDIDKVKNGDYLIVKSDTDEIKTSLIKTKVLEAEHKDKDFLGNNEKSGFYIKVKPENYRLNLSDWEVYNFHTYHNTRPAYENALVDCDNYTSKPHFYGDTLNDLSCNDGATNTLGYRDKKRYLIKIDNAGATDTFSWSDDNGQNWNATGVAVTAGVAQTLNNGLEITFANATGHSVNDEWNINMHGDIRDPNPNDPFHPIIRAYGFFRIRGWHDDTSTDTDKDVVFPGARIDFKYEEYGRVNVPDWRIDEIASTQYDDLEEWYYKENIEQKILASSSTFDVSHVNFVRGIVKYDPSVNGNASYIEHDETNGFMTMVVRSMENGTLAQYQKISAWSKVIQNDSYNYLVFETEPTDTEKEIFHEIGRTYKIIDGYHTKEVAFETSLTEFTGEQDQTAGQDLKVRLDWFNAWSWGNAVESYKIKDDFNAHALDNGVRVSASTKDKYKEVHRVADLTWADVYTDDTKFNGLATFNLSLINFEQLNKENGAIQRLHNDNGNLLVMQEDAVGLMPYNKNVIYDTKGKELVGIATNILDKRSYKAYAGGIHGISKHPESFVAVGHRKFFTDQVRGDLLRLSIDGMTEINMYGFEHWFSDIMAENKSNKLVGGYDPKHKEYLLYIPSINQVIAFKDKNKGFPTFYTFKPDFMLGANNELYAWKNGKMYKMNATNTRNEFFGNNNDSKLQFFVNTDFSTEKIFKAMGLESSHAWKAEIETDLTKREIPESSFERLEDYWYSEIMGNTNNNINSNSIFGLGKYDVVNGIFTLNAPISTISVGDTVFASDNSFTDTVTSIDWNSIKLTNPINSTGKHLLYSKNQNIDGGSIRGDILDVTLTNSSTDKVTIRAVRTEVVKSFHS